MTANPRTPVAPSIPSSRPPQAPAKSQWGSFFKENGYLVVPGAFSPAEIEALNADAAKIGRGEYGPCPGLQPIQPGESDREVLGRHLCIHFPHKMSKLMLGAVTHQALAAWAPAQPRPHPGSPAAQFAC